VTVLSLSEFFRQNATMGGVSFKGSMEPNEEVGSHWTLLLLLLLLQLRETAPARNPVVAGR